jgi:hypothetical protein
LNLDLKSKVLPFDKFEEFVRALLNSRPTIPISEGKRKIELQKHDFVCRYGKQGDAQRGIDLIGSLSGGSHIVFQCKYHSPDAKDPRVGKTEAVKAIKLAEEKYPGMQFYALVTNSSFTPDAIDSLADAGWLRWDGEILNDLLRSLHPYTGYQLVDKFFGKPEADRLYPLGPYPLVEPKVALASRQDALAHRYACVGRDKEIAMLTQALAGKKRMAVILSGDGGLGKSRIFCEILSRLVGKKWKPRIFQKIDDSESSAKQLALLQEENLIVGMDECHLEGFFREDIAHAVLRHSKNGRLLLACRPEGLIKLRQTLRFQGWEIAEPLERTGGLQTMDIESMEQLAEQILGKGRPQARQLAESSSGNPLITVVAGGMLKEKGLHIRQIVNSDEFRKQVFKHLEETYLFSLQEDRRFEAKRVLRLLAVISPCSDNDLPSASQLLGMNETELEKNISQLRAAGLIRGSNESFRVIPDLFSDHLVRQALGKGDDSGLLKRLMKSELITQGGSAVFRNLAMARWATDAENSALDPLIRNLWESYRRNFATSFDKKRCELLSSWRQWGIYLPKESLELAEMALEAEPNPDPEIVPWLYEGLESHFTKSLHSDAIHILSDLAKYHIDHQERALEVLWKHRDKETGSNGRSKPGAIAQVFGPEADFTIASPLSALKWLGAEVRKPATFRDWTETRTNDPAYFLSPAFASQYDASYDRGNTVYFVTRAFRLDVTAPLRDEAFGIIRDISLATVKGALNCIDLLHGNAAPFHPMRGGKSDEKWLQEFEQCRLASLQMLLEIARHHENSMVRFLIRKGLLRPVAYWNSSPEIAEIRLQILGAIPETHELNLMRVLLSNSYEEFSQDHIEDAVWKNDALQNLWEKLCDEVAAEMLEKNTNVRELLELWEEIAGSMKEHGLEPNFYELFQAFRRIDPKHFESLRQHILHHAGSCFTYLYGNLCLDDSDAKLAEAADLGRPELFTSVCDWLHRQKDESAYPLSRSRVARECRAALGERIDVVLDSIHFSYLSTALSTLLLENLPWLAMNAQQMARVGEKMSHRNSRIPALPSSVYPAILDRLNELPMEAIVPMGGILHEACLKFPSLTFGFFEDRVRRAMDLESNQTPCVFPPTYENNLRFPDIRGIADYESKTRAIFEALKANSESQPLKQWFRIAVIDSGNLAAAYLGEWIDAAEIEKDLMRVSKIITESSSTFVYSEPDLIHRLLSKAQTFSRECLRIVERGLVQSLVFRARGYTNGIPDDQRILNLAREHRERHAAEPLLYYLFDQLVRFEEADAEQHRREFLARDEEGRRFE